VLINDNMSSSVATRRFGTDVSNIPSDIVRKTPQKVAPRQQAAKSHSTKLTTNEKQSNTSVSQPLFDVMESLKDNLVNDVVIDDEISVRSPIKENIFSMDCRYERDFLMSFQKLCTDPILGLIPEVTPGYVHPEISSDSLSNSSSTNHSSRNLDESSSSTAEQASSSSNQSSSIVSSSEVTASRTSKNGSSSSKYQKSSSKSSSVGATSDSSSGDVSSSIKNKKIKKEKPRELDEKRIAARQKQIDIGMNTDGYRRFMATVPAESRTKSHPRVPDVRQVCSKRSWDGQVRKWRRQLHDYDLSESAGQILNAADHEAIRISSEGEDSSDNEEEESAVV